MNKRKLRFVTEKSDEEALVDPFYLPQICITILAQYEARFITVYDPDNNMRTVFVAHYNSDVISNELYDKYTYCFFDGSKNKHLEKY